jgi:thiol-disulfide isomerase/thioredoxin
MTRTPLAAALVSCLCLAPPLFAQDKAAQQADNPAAAADAAKLLDQARKAITDLHALSYTATVEGAGALAGKVPTVQAEVTAARADAGGWKIYTKGTSSGADSGKTSFEVSYDGATAYSNKAKDKVIFEKEPDNLSELSVFFSGQGAKHPIAWEIVADQPLDLNGGTATAEGEGKVGDAACDIVLMHPKPLDVGADTDAKDGVRVWLARSDHLPRKIERLLGSPAGSPQSRVLTISDLKLNESSIGAAYTMQVPDGYQVKNPDPKPERQARGGGGGGGGGGQAAGGAAPGVLKVGDAAPDFTLKDASGKEHSLHGYKGKIVLLDFWATWCGPCRMAMPGVQKIHDKFKGQPVVVIGMNTSENADPVKFMKDKKFTYGLLLNAETIGDKYGIQGIPAFFLIGPDGKLLWTEVGYNPAGEQEATDIIEKTLKGMEK